MSITIVELQWRKKKKKRKGNIADMVRFPYYYLLLKMVMKRNFLLEVERKKENEILTVHDSLRQRNSSLICLLF